MGIFETRDMVNFSRALAADQTKQKLDEFAGLVFYWRRMNVKTAIKNRYRRRCSESQAECNIVSSMTVPAFKGNDMLWSKFKCDTVSHK